MRSAVQLYTLRDLDATVEERLDLVASEGFDGVEFAGFGDANPQDVAAAVADLALGVASAHVDAATLEASFDAATERCRTVGAKTLVVPYLDELCFATPDAVDETANELSALATTLDTAGLTFCYHNHVHEFEHVADTTAWERLVDATTPPVAFELDVGWARAAGHDPAALLSQYGDRIPLVHLKDVDADAQRPVELGEGDVDLDACVRAAAAADVSWLVYEHDEPDDPRASLAHAADWLDDHATFPDRS